MDPRMFVPYRSNDPKILKAKKVCSGCTVRQACLESALTVPADTPSGFVDGVWGGTTEQERVFIRLLMGIRTFDQFRDEAISS